MRHIVQPGPVAAQRVQWVEAQGTIFTMHLRRGMRLLDAVQQGFEAAGCSSGVLNFSTAALGPLAYVMPALSQTPDHAAFYSDMFQPQGISRTSIAAMTFGLRDEKPFFHCHGLWREADGKMAGGHILPETTMIAESFEARALGLNGAAFAVEADPETGFKLFGPVPCAATDRVGARVFVLRLRPNQDICTVLEQFCVQRGLASATLHGGVGSIVGADFADGRRVEAFATEMAIRSGSIAPGKDAKLEAALDIALVDDAGTLSQGVLRRGENPVLITLEAVLQAD